MHCIALSRRPICLKFLPIIQIFINDQSYKLKNHLRHPIWERRILKLVQSNDLSKETPISGSIEILNFHSRLKIAGKACGFFLILTFISVFIPAAHFILVPTFLIVSFISLFSNLAKNKSLKMMEKAPCPVCKNPLQIPSSFKGELRFRCKICAGQFILIEANT